MMHNYFISYYVTEKGSATVELNNFGNSLISLENITDADTIKYIERDIESAIEEEEGIKVNVIILNWRRMEDPD